MNADDFGLSEGVNRGIAACFHDGILRSASLMPNGAAFEHAVSLARQTPGLGVGIHLSLVGELPVAPPSELGGLVDARGLLPASYAAFARGLFGRRFSLFDVRREVEAQVERFLGTGLRPTHLDSHQHVHLLPDVFDIALDAAKRANIGVIRVPHERPRALRLDARGLQLHVLSLLCRRAKRRARAAGFRVASHFWGLNASGHLDEAALLNILSRTGRGVNEVMSHPGFSDEALRLRYEWGYSWDEEAHALRARAVRELVQQRGFRLAHFGNAWEF